MYNVYLGPHMGYEKDYSLTPQHRNRFCYDLYFTDDKMKAQS